MSMYRTQKFQIALIAVAGLFAAAGAQAAYVNGFEGAEYINNTRLSSITDGPSGNTWTLITNGTWGTGIEAAASTAHPSEGVKHIRITDTTTSSNTFAALDLGTNVGAMLTQPFTFKISVARAVNSGGLANQIVLGRGTGYNSDYAWVAFSMTNSGTAVINVSDPNNGSYNGFSTRQADGNAFLAVPVGSYMNFEFTLNPATYTYTSIKVNGVEQLGISGSLGTVPSVLKVPHTSTLPLVTDRSLKIYTGGTETVTLDVDGMSIAIPEPATLGLLAIGGLMMLPRTR